MYRTYYISSGYRFVFLLSISILSVGSLGTPCTLLICHFKFESPAVSARERVSLRYSLVCIHTCFFSCKCSFSNVNTCSSSNSGSCSFPALTHIFFRKCLLQLFLMLFLHTILNFQIILLLRNVGFLVNVSEAVLMKSLQFPSRWLVLYKRYFCTDCKNLQLKSYKSCGHLLK